MSVMQNTADSPAARARRAMRMNVASGISARFRKGEGALIPWEAAQARLMNSAIREVAALLVLLPPEDTFAGADHMQADRQSFWLGAQGIGSAFSARQGFIESLDGNLAGGRRGLAVLAEHPGLRPALDLLKAQLDNALALASAAVDIPVDILPRMTVRYRFIRYAPLRHRCAGIGLHPDGNVISALITDSPGLSLYMSGMALAPSLDGTILLPGSILYRWSNGYYQPAFHRVELRRGAKPKISIVAFLNFADRANVPRAARHREMEPYFNDVQAAKEDDMNRTGDLAALWHRHDQLFPSRQTSAALGIAWINGRKTSP
jgi:hypothetical protein